MVWSIGDGQQSNNSDSNDASIAKLKQEIASIRSNKNKNVFSVITERWDNISSLLNDYILLNSKKFLFSKELIAYKWN